MVLIDDRKDVPDVYHFIIISQHALNESDTIDLGGLIILRASGRLVHLRGSSIY